MSKHDFNTDLVIVRENASRIVRDDGVVLEELLLLFFCRWLVLRPARIQNSPRERLNLLFLIRHWKGRGFVNAKDTTSKHNIPIKSLVVTPNFVDVVAIAVIL